MIPFPLTTRFPFGFSHFSTAGKSLMTLHVRIKFLPAVGVSSEAVMFIVFSSSVAVKKIFITEGVIFNNGEKTKAMIALYQSSSTYHIIIITTIIIIKQNKNCVNNKLYIIIYIIYQRKFNL